MAEPSGRAAAPSTPRRLGQVPGLDGIRGVAVLAVVLSHLNRLLPNSWSGAEFRRATDGGWLGVDVFFVLSGFLITALLLDEQGLRGRNGIGAFYARRALRLLPALYFMLACYALYTFIAGLPVTAMWQSTLGAMFYVTNWLAIYKPTAIAPGTGHLWSLAVEEQFYLVWPLLLTVAFGLNRRARWVIPALITLFAALAIQRAFRWEHVGGWITAFSRTDFRADSLLIGALLGQLWVRRLTPTRGLRVATRISLTGIGVMMWNADVTQRFWYEGGYTLFAVLTAIVVLSVVEGTWRRGVGFEHPWLRWFGRISYGLYLWHLPAIRLVADRYPLWSWTHRTVVATAVTALGVGVSWFCVEQPALRFKRRWEVRDLGPRPVDGGPDLPVSGHLPPAHG
ncbi:MAG: acyltransferase family protein [Actinomycetota bacterium]